MKKNQKGFTLIELLVVIAIIGILAALVLVALGNARTKAQDARIKSNVSQYRTLGEVYYDANSASYTGFEDCVRTATLADCAGSIEGSIGALNSDLNTVYGNGSGIITMPDSETSFVKHVNTAGVAGTAFCVAAALKDGTTYVCNDSAGTVVESGTSATCVAASGLCV